MKSTTLRKCTICHGKDAACAVCDGGQSHPLSAHALRLLSDLTNKAVPLQEINAGVLDRLGRRSGLLMIVRRPSPYAVHKGGKCDHAALTVKGIELVEKLSKLPGWKKLRGW